MTSAHHKPQTADPHGIVVVDKPSGLTSHDVVARLRRIAGTRKVGHAGTLDPLATGVLVLGVGRATRLLGHLQLADKTYEATIRLGQATTTDDAEGEVISATPAGHLTPGQIETELAHFVGEIDQVPATVSAIKVDGQRAYRRVRAGEAVQLASRRVRIDQLVLHRVRPVGDPSRGDLVDADITMTCSSGTYVRSVARDLGDRLGVGGHLTALRRTRVGGFSLTDAATLEQLQDGFHLTSMAQTAVRTFATTIVDADQARAVGFGQDLPPELAPHDGVPVAVMTADDEFLALYQKTGDRFRPVAVFTG